MQAQIDRLHDNSRAIDQTRITHLISVLIVQGDLHEAMTQAKRLLIDNPTAPEGAQQICRVFKAADLNTIRANAFIAYLGGEGTNPMTAFFKEHEKDVLVAKAP